MAPDNISDSKEHDEQLKKYAADLAKVYKSEKAKRKELENAYGQMKKYAEALSGSVWEVREINKNLQDAYLDTIHRLVLAAEYKDEDTGDHIVRMSRYSGLVAEKLGMSSTEVQDMLYAAPMHDIGKIGIPDSILLKPGKLTNEEFDTMKTHTTIGANILANSKADIIRMSQQIAISHHEKWNGRGYPQGLAGDKIPMTGRIVGIADVFDALTSKRPYKDPYPLEVALKIIKEEREEHFDPDVVDVFLENIDGIVAIKEEVGTAEDISLADFSWSERDNDQPIEK